MEETKHNWINTLSSHSPHSPCLSSESRRFRERTSYCSCDCYCHYWIGLILTPSDHPLHTHTPHRGGMDLAPKFVLHTAKRRGINPPPPLPTPSPRSPEASGLEWTFSRSCTPRIETRRWGNMTQKIHTHSWVPHPSMFACHPPHLDMGQPPT